MTREFTCDSALANVGSLALRPELAYESAEELLAATPTPTAMATGT